MPTRRQFLQVGAAGAAILVAARLLAPSRTPGSYRVLDLEGAAIVAALAPVVLDGALPAAGPERSGAIDEVVHAFDRAVSGLSPAVQDEIDQLLGVLRFAPTRIALTGSWAPLPEASADDVAAFLSRWRESRFDLLRAGYQALTQLVQASWYGNSASWDAIGYPGPPPLPGNAA